MTKKFDEFVVALKELCRDHEVVLSTYGYDSIQVWDAEEDQCSGEEVVCSGIDDMTEDRACISGDL